MSIVSPLTAGNEITRSFARGQSIALVPLSLEQTSADPFVGERLSLSKQAQDKQQKDALIRASEDNSELPSESVSVSSSVGRSRSRGNLTAQRAINLYQAIASLL